VAAGVYLLVRMSWLWVASPIASEVEMFVGALTSLFAAFTAIGQRDLKRVLAFSTVSQLGYMVMAVGAGLPTSRYFTSPLTRSSRRSCSSLRAVSFTRCTTRRASGAWVACGVSCR